MSKKKSEIDLSPEGLSLIKRASADDAPRRLTALRLVHTTAKLRLGQRQRKSTGSKQAFYLSIYQDSGSFRELELRPARGSRKPGETGIFDIDLVSQAPDHEYFFPSRKRQRPLEIIMRMHIGTRNRGYDGWLPSSIYLLGRFEGSAEFELLVARPDWSDWFDHGERQVPGSKESHRIL
jgi:hypothetical protein